MSRSIPFGMVLIWKGEMIVAEGYRASHERNIRNMASVAVSLRGLVIACLYLL